MAPDSTSAGSRRRDLTPSRGSIAPWFRRRIPPRRFPAPAGPGSASSCSPCVVEPGCARLRSFRQADDRARVRDRDRGVEAEGRGKDRSCATRRRPRRGALGPLGRARPATTGPTPGPSRTSPRSGRPNRPVVASPPTVPTPRKTRPRPSRCDRARARPAGRAESPGADAPRAGPDARDDPRREPQSGSTVDLVPGEDEPPGAGRRHAQPGGRRRPEHPSQPEGRPARMAERPEQGARGASTRPTETSGLMHVHMADSPSSPGSRWPPTARSPPATAGTRSPRPVSTRSSRTWNSRSSSSGRATPPSGKIRYAGLETPEGLDQAVPQDRPGHPDQGDLGRLPRPRRPTCPSRPGDRGERRPARTLRLPRPDLRPRRPRRRRRLRPGRPLGAGQGLFQRLARGGSTAPKPRPKPADMLPANVAKDLAVRDRSRRVPKPADFREIHNTPDLILLVTWSIGCQWRSGGLARGLLADG